MTSSTSTAASSCPSAISLGSCIAGIPIRLHYSFFLLLLLEFVSALLNRGEYPLLILFVVVLYGPILLVTILVRGNNRYMGRASYQDGNSTMRSLFALYWYCFPIRILPLLLIVIVIAHHHHHIPYSTGTRIRPCINDETFGGQCRWHNFVATRRICTLWPNRWLLGGGFEGGTCWTNDSHSHDIAVVGDICGCQRRG